MDTWLVLTVREQDRVRVRIPEGSKMRNVELLRRLQAKLDRRGELTLTAEELRAVKAAYRDWRGGYQEAFAAILDALGRAPTY